MLRKFLDLIEYSFGTKTNDKFDQKEFVEYKPNKDIVSSTYFFRGCLLNPALTASVTRPPDSKFTEEYLSKNNLLRLGGGYGMRGETRSPDEIGNSISPKMHSFFYPPHYDLQIHRLSPGNSGFVSLSEDPGIAQRFGWKYGKDDGSYFVYIAKYDDALKYKPGTTPDGESEVTAITPPHIDAYRSYRDHNYRNGSAMIHGNNIFIRHSVDESLRSSMIDAFLTSEEKEQGVTFS